MNLLWFITSSGVGEVKDILIVESKYSASGRARLSVTKSKGPQMGDKWIQGNIEKMIKYDACPLVQATGKFLEQNSHLIRRKVNLFDKANHWNKGNLPLTEAFLE